MIDAALRTFALVACSIIALSFVLFAAEKASDASHTTASSIVDPSGATERQREANHTKAREYIDDADDVLLRPFAAIVNSDNEWVQRGVPALFGVLAYGVLVLYLARLMKVRSTPLRPRRTGPAAMPKGPPGSSPPPGA